MEPPQGSSLSPTIFNYDMNIFLRLQLPEGVHILAYADDLVVYCVDRQNILTRLQSALDIMSTAASTHGFRFAPEKTMATWFYHANPDTQLRLYNQHINWIDDVKYLGVNINKQLNMHSHVTQTINSVSRSLNTIKVMSSLSGVNSNILLKTFNGCTRAFLDYGAECFNMLTLTQMRQLQRKQNNGLKLVLGVNKWAPTSNIHAELSILPLALRVEVFQDNLTVAIMTDITQPRDHIYYTDGSVSEGRVSAAFTYLGHPTLIRLGDTASIMQAELTAIHASLQHGLQSPSRCVVFSDSKSALQALLQHQPSDNINILRGIRDVASRLASTPLIVWIPSHIGIEGNEAADRAARRALFKPEIDNHLPMSKSKTKRNIKHTARDIYETIELLNPKRSVALHQQVCLSTNDN